MSLLTIPATPAWSPTSLPWLWPARGEKRPVLWPRKVTRSVAGTSWPRMVTTEPAATWRARALLSRTRTDMNVSSGPGSLSATVIEPECRPDERQRLGSLNQCGSLSCVVLYGLRDSSLGWASFHLPVGFVYPREEEFWRTSSVIPTRFFPRNGPFCQGYLRGSAGSSVIPI